MLSLKSLIGCLKSKPFVDFFVMKLLLQNEYGLQSIIFEYEYIFVFLVVILPNSGE